MFPHIKPNLNHIYGHNFQYKMKISKLLFTALFFLSSFNLISQEECGTDEILRRNPFLQQLYAERAGCAPEVDLETAEILTVPVVVHIVHLGEPVGEGTNISDEQVYSMIDNLNHRFRGDTEALAALTDEYDEYELSLVIDSKIEFCLAQRDPDNNPTNGIHRYNGSNLFWQDNTSNPPIIESYAEDGVANTNLVSGIDDAYMKETVGCWDSQKYFNIWIVSEIGGNNGGNGVQGYSYLGPTGSNCRYGPVCLYNVSGTVGNIKTSHNLNSTVTHEVGHALSLFHTFWGTAVSNPCSETNGCTQGDLCPDTPPTSTNNSGCTPVDCPDAMIENYMDYTPQTCRIAFTQNQIERMRDLLLTQLEGLVIDNIKCQPLNSNDLAITSVNLPSEWCRDEVSFTVKISNYGGNDVTGASIKINGVTYPLPPIDAGEFFNLGFTDYNLGDGYFDIEVIYPEDEYPTNNLYSTYVEPSESNWVEVIISPDVWSNEINWEIIDEFDEVIMEGGGYPFGSQNTDFYEGGCLSEGCYTFRVTDSAGDGMCSFSGDGVCISSYDAFINILSNNNLIFDLSDPNEIDFGSELIFEFCIVNCPEVYCQGDFDGDGSVTVTDLLDLLYNIGNVGTCSPYDFDNNGVVGTEDVLQFLSNLGLICGTGDFYDTGNLPEGIIKFLETGDLGDLKLDNEVKELNYYNLLGQKINVENYSGFYLMETQYIDGRKEFKKFFIERN